MTISIQTVESTLQEAFCDALKARFGTIATNALSVPQEEISKQLRVAFKNLKDTHDQAMAIARDVFVDV